MSHSTARAETDLAAIEGRLSVLGEMSAWKVPEGYPESLALCLLDSIWSLGVNYDRHVVPVLNRYRTLRTSTGATASADTATDLASTIASVGGGEAFADLLGNHQLTSTRSGILKATAVGRAALLMAANSIETPGDLRARQEAVAAPSRTIPGQRSSATGWRYLLLLAGGNQAKPDPDDLPLPGKRAWPPGAAGRGVLPARTSLREDRCRPPLPRSPDLAGPVRATCPYVTASIGVATFSRPTPA